jgi:predicted AAA+ superfamily ATPase
MNDAEIRRLLLDQNPWWRDPADWARQDVYLREAREAPFDYEPGVLADIAAPSLYVLTGPRRVGKSVELHRSIVGLLDASIPARSIVFCSCDGFREQDLRRLFMVGRNLTRTVEGPRYWLLDEITAVRGSWPAIVKSGRDAELADDCVVLTGSSSRGLREATKDLAGRRGPTERSDRVLLPAGFRRFCRLTKLRDLPQVPVLRPADVFTSEGRGALDELQFFAEPLAGAWEDYLRVGGFPRAIRDFLESGDVSAAFARDVWDVIRGGVIREGRMSDGKILELLARLSESLSTPLNLNTVATQLDLGSHHRVTERVDDLVEGYMAWRCPQAGKDSPSSRAARKLYFTDPLIARLPHLIDDQMHEPDVSQISEQQLGLALAQAIERHQPGSFSYGLRLQYLRSATRKEIDFVSPDFPGACFEGKYVDSGWKQESATARANCARGVFATRRVHDLDNPIWAVPAANLAYLLDHDPG